MRCILHVGPAKTGTTTIQGFLRAQRQQLAKAGVFVPELRRPRMDEVYVGALGRYAPRRLLGGLGIFDQPTLSAARDKARAELARSLRKARSPSAILSHELLAELPAEDLTDLRNWLAAHFREIVVVIAVRRQDLWLNSMHKNNVRNMGVTGFDPEATGPDYADLLGRLADVFGAAAVRPFVFPDSSPQPGDLLGEFFTSAGIELDIGAWPAPKSRNTNWDARGVEILAGINSLSPLPADGSIPAARQRMEKAIQNAFRESSGSWHMSREQADRVLAANAEGNARVAREWFGRAHLFNDRMSVYDRPVPQATPEDYLRVIAALAELGA